MATLDTLVTDVAAEDTAIDSAVKLLQGLSAQVAALTTSQTDPATASKINALASDIEAKTAALAAAVVVGTPVPPPVSATVPIVTSAAATDAANASVAATATPKV